MRPVDVIHLGPQKSGTTWIYECLREHTQVACAPKDSIHYYDMFYHEGPEWYLEQFGQPTDGQVIFDTTPSYIRSLRAPKRMYLHNPQAKLVLTLRHPIDRAFSHYWHERKNPKHQFDFTEILTNYDFFASWLESGFYAQHIERYLEHFDPRQLLCQRFEQMQEAPERFLKELLEFMGVDSNFKPSVIDIKINQASVVRTPAGKLRVKSTRALAKIFGHDFFNTSIAQSMMKSREYERGIDRELQNRLLQICLPEIEQTENLLDIDLSSWKIFK